MTANVQKFVRFCESEFEKKILEREAKIVYYELKDCRTILNIGCSIGQFEQALPSLNIIGLDSSDRQFASLYITTGEKIKEINQIIQEHY